MLRCPYGAVNNLLSKIGDDKDLAELLAYTKSLESDINKLQSRIKELKIILDKN